MSGRVVVELARIGFHNMLAFRLRYYAGVLNYFINVTVYYFIWQAIFRADPAFGGFDFPQMVTYVAVGWVIRSLYFNNIDYDLASDIMEGRITMELLRPVRVQVSYIARSLGESAFRLVMLTAPTALVIGFLFPVKAPASPAHFAAFAASLGGSIVLVAALNFIVGSCAVRMKSIQGLLRAKFYMQELLSGLLVPVTLFPAPLRRLSGWLPFQHIGFTPLMIYLGKVSWGEVGRVLALEAAWAATLLAAGAWFWSWMSRKITVHGG